MVSVPITSDSKESTLFPTTPLQKSTIYKQYYCLIANVLLIFSCYWNQLELYCFRENKLVLWPVSFVEIVLNHFIVQFGFLMWRSVIVYYHAMCCPCTLVAHFKPLRWFISYVWTSDFNTVMQAVSSVQVCALSSDSSRNTLADNESYFLASSLFPYYLFE